MKALFALMIIFSAFTSVFAHPRVYEWNLLENWDREAQMLYYSDREWFLWIIIYDDGQDETC